MRTVTEAEIFEKLARHYGGDNSMRRLFKCVHRDSWGSVGSIFFSLTGSPPKGYAIYIPELRLLNFYDNYGRRFRKMDDVELEERGEEG